MDDEALARRRISSLLKSDPSFEVVAECADGQSAIKAIAAHKPSLVFLDVQMPEVDGFGVLEAVAPTDMPAIIFVTAYDQYALKAFDAQAIDYLLKPFKQERFIAALARAKSSIQAGRNQLDPEALVALFRAVDRDRARLVVRSEGSVVFLRTAEVEWGRGRRQLRSRPYQTARLQCAGEDQHFRTVAAQTQIRSHSPVRYREPGRGR